MTKSETENEASPAAKGIRADYSRYERLHAGCDGLFAPRDKRAIAIPEPGVRANGSPVDLRTELCAQSSVGVCRSIPLNGRTYSYEVPGEGRVSFTVPYLLSSVDESVLLSLLCLAAQIGEPIGGDRLTGTEGIAQHRRVVRVQTTRYRLIEALGWLHNNTSYDRAAQSLDRLAAVTVRWVGAGYAGRHPLLEWDRLDSEVVAFAVDLNWRLSGVLLGDKDHYGYIAVDLHERRRLSGDVALCAHRWLSFWLSPGQSAKIGLDRLAEHVFASAAATSGVQRQRRFSLRRAMAQLRALGWVVREAQDGQISVRRGVLGSLTPGSQKPNAGFSEAKRLGTAIPPEQSGQQELPLDAA